MDLWLGNQPLCQELCMTTVSGGVGNLPQDILGEHFGLSGIQAFSAQQYVQTYHLTDVNTYVCVSRLLDREDERKGYASKAPCLVPAATFRQAILKALAPMGAGVSVIAPLPERLPGLVEGSLRPQSSFEYVCLVVNSL